MSTTTTNLGLIKPALTDPADITQLNKNWDVIDQNLMAPKDVERVKILNYDANGSGASYINFVIPLFLLESDNTNNYCSGDIFLKRYNGAGGRFTRISVSGGKQYGEASPYYTLSYDAIKSGNGVAILPRTFTYNGKKWFGIYVMVTSAGFDGTRYFVGKSSSFSSIEMISVYNNNTSEVLNEEIYNSLADEGISLPRAFTGTPKVITENGSNYDIIHEGNLPTPAQIGAAPADKVFQMVGNLNGYSDFDTATTQGIYYCNTWAGSGGANFPNGQDTGTMFVIHPEGNYTQQIYISDTDGIIRRMKWDDEEAWKLWEYENPPMKLATEYRTTERWQGKAVYTKVVDFGALPNATTKKINVGISYANIVSFECVLQCDEHKLKTYGPVFTDAGVLEIKPGFMDKSVLVYTTGDYTGWIAVFKLKYVKD